MNRDQRNALGAISAPGDDDAAVHEARQLLGMVPGSFDEAFRYRWRGWLTAVGAGPVNYITEAHMALLRRVRKDNGEVSLLVCLAGSAATAAPFVLAVSPTQVGSDVAFWAGVVVAVLAAGAGVWKAASAIYRWGRKIEDTFEAVAELKEQAVRMESRQLSQQEQIRDIADTIRAPE